MNQNCCLLCSWDSCIDYLYQTIFYENLFLNLCTCAEHTLTSTIIWRKWVWQKINRGWIEKTPVINPTIHCCFMLPDHLVNLLLKLQFNTEMCKLNQWPLWSNDPCFFDVSNKFSIAFCMCLLCKFLCLLQITMLRGHAHFVRPDWQIPVKSKIYNRRS